MSCSKNYRHMIKSINLLLEEFGDGKFTRKETKSLLKVGCFASLDCLCNNGLVEVSEVEYFDLPATVAKEVYDVTLKGGMVITVDEIEGKNLLLSGNRGRLYGYQITNVERKAAQGQRFYYAVSKNWKEKLMHDIDEDEIRVRLALNKAERKARNLAMTRESLQEMSFELSA
jgi:hypothetical protein